MFKMLSCAGVYLDADLWKFGIAYDRNCHAKITIAPINEKSSLRFILKGFGLIQRYKSYIKIVGINIRLANACLVRLLSIPVHVIYKISILTVSEKIKWETYFVKEAKHAFVLKAEIENRL
jgi:hypothetical protein